MTLPPSKPSAFYLDTTFWGVVAGNVLSIILAAQQGWDLHEVMWIYWAQSVIIGAMNVIRIASLKEFTTKNLLMNHKPSPETPKTKRQVAVFFALHYGAFHAGYFLFLWQELPLHEIAAEDLRLIILCVIGFIASHGFSLLRNMLLDFKDRKPDLGMMMFYPYMRIFPMHFTILFGGFFGGALVLFMILKTLADAVMHVIEHKIFQKSNAQLFRIFLTRHFDQIISGVCDGFIELLVSQVLAFL